MKYQEMFSFGWMKSIKKKMYNIDNNIELKMDFNHNLFVIKAYNVVKTIGMTK